MNFEDLLQDIRAITSTRNVDRSIEAICLKHGFKYLARSSRILVSFSHKKNTRYFKIGFYQKKELELYNKIKDTPYNKYFTRITPTKFDLVIEVEYAKGITLDRIKHKYPTEYIKAMLEVGTLRRSLRLDYGINLPLDATEDYNIMLDRTNGKIKLFDFL